MKKKILIVEDDADTSKMLGYIADELHCEAIRSLHGLSVHDVRAIPPDLILLDHWLGNTTGSNICAVLKNNPETKHIPIIMLSAESTIKEIAKAYCAEDYIQKPFDVNMLERTIKKFLRVKK